MAFWGYDVTAFSPAKPKMVLLARLLLAGLMAVSLGAEALGKNDLWPNCREGDPGARIAACTKILARGNQETKRNRIAAYINRSSAYRTGGDLDAAAADLDKALQLNPKSPLALTKRGSLYYEKGDLDPAIAAYDAAIAARPKFAAAFAGRAEAFRAKNDLDHAIADFTTALRLDKNTAAAFDGRAKAFQAKGELDKALADLDEAVRLDPQSALTYAERGAVYQAKADHDHAIADYSQAIERDPRFAGALLGRAKAYLGKQEFNLARQDILRALDLDPQLPAANEALDKLDRLFAKSASSSSAPHDHTDLPWPLALPFAGMLLSIALGPLVVKEWWHIHYEKAAAFWAILTLTGLITAAGLKAAAAGLVHSMAGEYVPFILMLFALYTAAGGIAVEGRLNGTPRVNTAILALGTAVASIIGTTGASMILIRPLIRANSERGFKTHVVVFFIFLVSNIGGVLSPLGDPPLFLGFLEGIDFFWPARALWPAALFTAGVLLLIFFLVDSYFYRREKSVQPVIAGPSKLRVSGLVNAGLIGIVIAAIAASGVWHPGIGFDVLGTRIELQNLIRELVMVLVGIASILLTHKSVRAANGFEWEPIREVAYLFAGIFICIIPVMAMLHAGTNGPFSAVITALDRADGTPNNIVYFWATGLLSSFLDNAPTYLVFFQLAGGDPATLMGPLASTLTAISLGAVFMGANTYIGNAPNFMVYAIARSAGVKMPGFFPYMLWSGAILLPVFAAVTWLFLR